MHCAPFSKAPCVRLEPVLLFCLSLACPAAAEPAKVTGHSGAKGHERYLTGSSTNTDPTIDEVDNVIFSRPPYSKQETNQLVYYSIAGIYILCAIVLLVSFNLDQSERRKRRARALVPEESVPCAIAEQYYLDEQLVAIRSSQDFQVRKVHMGVGAYVLHFGALLPDSFSKQHLLFSLTQAIPTFTRMKRGLLIVVQLHLCILTSAIVYNILEHEKPSGKYEMLSCDGALATSKCTATLPLSILAALILYPVFRFAAVRQMRLSCFISQSHPSGSRFPLNVRKFAAIPAKSPFESFFCMRNAYERRQVQVLQSRSLANRVVNMLWRTTQPSIKDLRYYSKFTSLCILFAMLFFMGLTCAYVVVYTTYLSDDAVYHWLAWLCTMFFVSILVLEPLQIVAFEVAWCSIVASLAQRWGFGAHALAATTRYKDTVRQIETLFIKGLRIEASCRIARWWLAVLDMYRAINEQTAAAIKIQAIRKKMIHQKKYIKERKWCMKIEVLDCLDLAEVQLNNDMSPFIRLQCDVENPTIMQTKVSWDTGRRATYNETFFVDIKESYSMYVSVWNQTLNGEEFVGRGYFEFNQLKSSDKDKPEGHVLKLPLYNIQHGEKRPRNGEQRGYVNVRVLFIDPLKEPIGGSDEEEMQWMLPKHRMQFALSKMGGRVRVSKMLGGYGVQATPGQTAQAWQVGSGTTENSFFRITGSGAPPDAAGGREEVGASDLHSSGYFLGNMPRGFEHPPVATPGPAATGPPPVKGPGEVSAGRTDVGQPSAAPLRSVRTSLGRGGTEAESGDFPAEPPPAMPPAQAPPPGANMSLNASSTAPGAPSPAPPPAFAAPAGNSAVLQSAALPGQPDNDGDDEIDPLTGMPVIV